MTRIILVRHGETEWNRVERFRGRADVPLNPTGLAQADATGRRIAAEWQPDAIYTGPLARTFRTAEAIAAHCQLPIEVEARLVDIDYGSWQGLAPGEVRTRWPEALDTWYSAPHVAQIPEGETLEDVQVRAMAAVNELAARHVDQTIVLVSHTVVNRVILLSALGLSLERFWRLRQDTCAINVFETTGRDFDLVTTNDRCHLRDQPPGVVPLVK